MSEVIFDKNLSCEKCGRFGACDFSGRTLCAECYEQCGSCCLEFGADDLWPADPDCSQVLTPTDARTE